ncbi:MAG: NAD-dependent epimerase/dehydratase family protein [Methanobrevibacter sp.]|uniref:NAD-dependent epimerase/dehydratase family protein n=1 Tax=Methanobrevibacter sp. TaxID=66852 RepID=UPI0025E6B9D4|nr:NAD-dependent epimerase/dehydratase family protein [Methanobrevibacter sp.]MBE6508083.1 NAD-dependent epimerase/dehydratase family protein [Methanobrevibacter sp.]
MKNKNILVTGGLGFIGSHISNELLKDNKVIIIDNLSTGNINNLNNPEHENLKIIKQDIRNVNFDDLTSGIDYIFHLAAMASVPLSVDKPVECCEINVNATVKLLDSAVKNDVKKIILSSSSSVYGQNRNMPLKESETPMPTSPYAASKVSCEMYLKSFYDSYGLNYTSLRYFNVFGPGQNKNSQYASVIPNFIGSILEGSQPEIYGDGEQTRDFVYVKDVVRANINACESDFNGIVNVASGKRMSVNRLYEIIKDTLNSDIEAKYLPKRKGDIKHSLADVSNLERINVKIDSENFENQLIETIEWFKTIL